MLLGLRGGWGGLAGHLRGEVNERGLVVGGGDAVPLMKRRVIQFCGSCPFLGVIAVWTVYQPGLRRRERNGWIRATAARAMDRPMAARKKVLSRWR